MNFVRPAVLELMLTGQFDWLGDEIRVVLLDQDYVVEEEHEVFADLDPARIVVVTDELVSKAATDGVADAADTTVTPPTGRTVTGLWVYRVGPSDAESELIAWMDSDEAGTPFEFETSGAETTIRWSESQSRVFRI